MIKNELIFLKIKSHSKENIEWHYMQFELNSNSNLIELRCNWNDFKFNNLKNGMQIGVEGIENLLITFCHLWLWC